MTKEVFDFLKDKDVVFTTYDRSALKTFQKLSKKFGYEGIDSKILRRNKRGYLVGVQFDCSLNKFAERDLPKRRFLIEFHGFEEIIEDFEIHEYDYETHEYSLYQEGCVC